MNTEIQEQLSRNEQPLVAERFSVHKKLGQGTYGCVYLACDTSRFNRPVALKVQDPPKERGSNYLELEAGIYSNVGRHSGFAESFYFERFPSGSVLALQCLGPSLERLFTRCNRQISLATVFSVGFQLLQSLETLHSFGVVHRDIKPANIVTGTDKNAENVYLVDFGSAARFMDPRNQHLEMKSDRPLVGTVQFASLNAHHGYSLSRRDDIESLAYVLILLATGSLPWMKQKGRKKTRYERIKIEKQFFDASSIPRELFELLAHAHSLTFDQRPEYGRFKKLFHDAMRARIHESSGVPNREFRSFWNKTIETDANVQAMKALLEKSREIKQAEEKIAMEDIIKSMFTHISEHCDVPFVVEDSLQRRLFDRLELHLHKDEHSNVYLIESRKRKVPS